MYLVFTRRFIFKSYTVHKKLIRLLNLTSCVAKGTASFLYGIFAHKQTSAVVSKWSLFFVVVFFCLSWAREIYKIHVLYYIISYVNNIRKTKKIRSTRESTVQRKQPQNLPMVQTPLCWEYPVLQTHLFAMHSALLSWQPFVAHSPLTWLSVI